jgi:hypothetical protein
MAKSIAQIANSNPLRQRSYYCFADKRVVLCGDSQASAHIIRAAIKKYANASRDVFSLDYRMGIETHHYLTLCCLEPDVNCVGRNLLRIIQQPDQAISDAILLDYLSGAVMARPVDHNYFEPFQWKSIV